MYHHKHVFWWNKKNSFRIWRIKTDCSSTKFLVEENIDHLHPKNIITIHTLTLRASYLSLFIQTSHILEIWDVVIFKCTKKLPTFWNCHKISIPYPIRLSDHQRETNMNQRHCQSPNPLKQMAGKLMNSRLVFHSR